MTKDLPDMQLPQFEVVPATVDQAVARAVHRFGIDAVKAAIKRQKATKRGRPRIPDLKELRPYIEQDARTWLNGSDPIAGMSDYALAKAIADAKPGHNHSATMQRIERKLREKPGRAWLIYFTAWELSREEYSYKRHLAALEALSQQDDANAWSELLSLSRAKVAAYEQHSGPPPDEATMKQIEEGSTPTNALLRFVSPGRRGVFGSGKLPLPK